MRPESLVRRIQSTAHKPSGTDRACLSAADPRNSVDESTYVTGKQQLSERNQAETGLYSLPAIATAGTSIPGANLVTLPAHTKHPISASRSSHSPDPVQHRLRHSTIQPTSPGRPPSQVSGSHLPAWGLHGYRRERSPIHTSTDANSVCACSRQTPLRQVTLSNPGGEL